MSISSSHEAVSITVPARREDTLIVSMALSGLGMMSGLDVNQLGDLRTVTCECFDCLCHQAGKPALIRTEASVKNSRFVVSFEALEREHAKTSDTLDTDITRAVLETLMPSVSLSADAEGVYSILCSMPL